MIACMFSGQGSQYPGMGRDLAAGSAAARRVYEEAADVLGFDIMDLDEEQLSQPRFTQLSVVVLSLAAWRAFGEAACLPAPAAFAGFSAGEYSALGASGVLGMTGLLRLVGERARLMQEASDECPGAMFAVLGLDDSRVLEITGKPDYAGKVFAANFNCPGQVVISGMAGPAESCAEELKSAGARRISKLRVGGAFHTPLMAEAAQNLAVFAKSISFGQPSGFLYSNTTGCPMPENPDWPSLLALHMSSPVLWTQETLRIAQDGASSWVEFGPGKVLCGLIRKTIAGAAPLPVEDSASLAEALKTLF